MAARRRDKILAIVKQREPINNDFNTTENDEAKNPANENPDNEMGIDSLLCREELPTSDIEDDVMREDIDIWHNSDDSCNDKDYIPYSDETTDDEILEENITISKTSLLAKKIQYTAKELGIAKNQHATGQTVEAAQNNAEGDENSTFNQEAEHQMIEEENTNDTEQSVGERERTDEENQVQNQIILQEEATTSKGFTKSGEPRKRKKYDESIEERKIRKKRVEEIKYMLKDPCNILTCKKKCTSYITEEQRKEIHDKYVNLNFEAKGLFIKCSIDTKAVQRRKVTSNEKRTITYKYYMNASNLQKTEVCKTFFLTTLGYEANNDSKIKSVMKKDVDKQKNLRGSYERVEKIDKEIIKDHIKQFNPSVSHYRREHAPNRLYLPSDLSVTAMHKQFLEQNPEAKISLESYRLVVKKDMNISFAHLGHEECETCAIFEIHDTNHKDNPDNTCEICNDYITHKKKYEECRSEYQNDVKTAAEVTTDVFYSADLQKVIMLPRIDQFKAAIFCPRIIAFNESFVPLGKTTLNHVPFAALWNETVSGRNQEDLISTFRLFVLHKRDAENITIWVDNCAAQNKNWAFFSFLVEIVNSNIISAKTITLKYFEPGHSFMSADSFHHQVERSLKKKGKVYDFSDFVHSVQVTNSGKNVVKIMEISDFFSFQDLASQHKLRKMEPRIYLKDMMCVQVQRGLLKIMYKTSHAEENFTELDFLQVKISKSMEFPQAVAKTEPRGIDKERKAAIITKLVPLMPTNRRNFWYNLPISSSPVIDN